MWCIYYSISAKLANWERELAQDKDKDFLLRGISNGFRIIEETEVVSGEQKQHLLSYIERR